MAFLDPSSDRGTVAVRTYLLSRSQFADVMTQEMHVEPGADVTSDGEDPLANLPDGAHHSDGAHHAVGPGRYETVVRVGTLDGRPLLTFTAPTTAGADLQPPSHAYLQTLAVGLRDAHAWSAVDVADYLHDRPGLHPHWSYDNLLRL